MHKMKKFLIALLFAPIMAFASGGNVTSTSGRVR
jgi:hypothetical protein